MEALYNKNGECRSGSRCKKYRVCEECNKIRQANIANVTELASRFSANARYSVVMPFNEGQDPQLINKLKTRITRKLRKSVDGTFISVETSANDALHLNLITLSKTDFNPLVFDKELKRLGVTGSVFSEPIQSSDVRRITAYSTKIDSIPSKELYAGNIYSTTGSVRTAGHFMQSQRMFNYAPAVAITAMCNKLIQMGLVPPSSLIQETNTFAKMVKLLVLLAEQVDAQDICYHPTLGLLNKDEFAKFYNRSIGACKSEITRSPPPTKLQQHRTAIANAERLWRDNPKNIANKTIC